MTNDKRLKLKYPHWGHSAIMARVKEFDKFDSQWELGWESMKPVVKQAVEYAGLRRIPSPLCYLTYKEIAEYAWDLIYCDCFSRCAEVLERHGQVITIDRPEDATKLISPRIFAGPLWAAFATAGVKRYDELPGKRFDLHKTKWHPTSAMRDLLATHDLVIYMEKGVALLERLSGVEGYVRSFKRYKRVVFHGESTLVMESVERAVQQSILQEAHLQYQHGVGVVLK